MPAGIPDDLRLLYFGLISAMSTPIAGGTVQTPSTEQKEAAWKCATDLAAFAMKASKREALEARLADNRAPATPQLPSRARPR